MSDNVSALRGVSNLRDQRAEVDTGSGTKRVGADKNRSAHISRGTFVNYYDDLGISTTPKGAKLIREDEAAFDDKTSTFQETIDTNYGILEGNKSTLNARQTNVDTLQSQYDTTIGRVSDYGTYSAPDKSGWWQTEKARGYDSGDYKYISLYDRSNNFYGGWWVDKSVYEATEGDTDSYYSGGNWQHRQLIIKHESHLDTIARQLQGYGDNWVAAMNTGYNSTSALGAEAHSSNLDILTGDVTTASGFLTSAKISRDEAQSGVTGVQGTISTQEMELQGAKDNRQAEWDQMYANRERRKKNMQDFFNQLDLGVG